MNDNLILIVSVLVSALIGAYLGMLFTKLKSKSEKSTLEERQNQLSITISELKQTVEKVENEREEIRKEKDFLLCTMIWTIFLEDGLKRNLKRCREKLIRNER